MKTFYRTRTYIAADFDHDKDAVDQLHKWNNDDYWSLTFTDAHELQTSNDSSLYCSIKSSLKMRMDHSKTFVLIVGDYTKSITKGGCQYCGSYNSYNRWCARSRSVVDYRSYIEYECEKAVEAGIKIIILYKAITVNRSKCPDTVKYLGYHTAMICYKSGKYYWDYVTVKKAFGDINNSLS